MSQAGKILHLYVEVRSVPEDEEGHGSGDVEVINTTRPQGGDALPPCGHTSEAMHRRGSGNQTYSPSRSPSRPSVSFQLQQKSDCMEPSSVHRQSLPYDGIGHLFSSLQPLNNGASVLLRAHSSESEYFPGRSLHSSITSGSTTAPTTPTTGRRSSEVLGSEEGQRSVVTFSYIEKASIRSVESPQSSSCQRGLPAPTNPLCGSVEERMTPALLRKRLSDPIHLRSQDFLCGSSTKLHCQASGEQPPNLRHATIDSIARAATHRALEKFGSPELQRRAVNVSDSPGPSTPQQSRCQSRNSSPAPVRSANTLRSTCVADPQKNRFGCSLPQSPATEQLCSHTRQPAVTLSPSPKSKAQESPRPPCKPTPALHDKPSTAGNENLNSKRIGHTPNESSRSAQRVNFNLGNSHSQLADRMNQLGSKKSVSPANSPEVARKLAEEATKLSTIFMEARRSPSPTHVGDSDSPSFPCYLSQETQRCSFSPDRGSPVQHHTEMSIPLHSPSRRDSDCLGGRHHTVKADMNSPVYLRKEQRGDSTTPSRQSPALPNIESPPIPTKVHRASPLCADMIPSPITDPRQQRPELPADDSPVLHQDQPPQYTGKSRSPSPEWSHKSRYERGMRDCPEVARKVALVEHRGICTAEVLVSRNSQQRRRNAAPAGGNSSKVVLQDKQFVATTFIESKGIEQSSIEADNAPTRDRGKNGLGALLKSEVPTYGDQSGMLGSSHSSSGVTGSLGDSSQPDQNCMSPENSQSSQKSSDTGHATSVIQSDSGCSPMGPSLHSQRIARAKWEFLFGTPSSEGSDSAVKNPADIGDSSTAPPSGTSSESPTPTPPNSLPLKTALFETGPEGMSQSLASHNVQHVEVELVTPPPAAAGASPKTGIIRRTIKYSETDLDAVPLRCYRETNIDEVLAEQEEADSAFGSNRSVMGTSGTGSSPLEGALYVRADGEEDLEEELQDEEVVSWASVRMQGDRKRQHATQEEDEVYSLLLKRSLDSLSESPTAQKSPIAVTSPRRVSEDSLDTFSRHFESIMESHRAKGTSYSSLDSEDLLTSSQAVFTFDLPTLTPEIQGQICQSARDIIELSFAPLAQSEPSSFLDSAHDTGDQLHSGGGKEIAQARSSEGLNSTAEDMPPSGTRHGSLSIEQNRQQNTQPQSREKPTCLASDSDLDRSLSEGRGLGSTDTLINGNKADLEAAKRLAKRLFNLDGFKKSDVARHLSKNNDFSRMVAEEYLRFFDFTGLTVDQALRVFLKEFALMGETQERERVLSHFSRRYLQCNPKMIPSEDSVHTLTCALMLLNTDLHGHNVGKRMSCPQFIGNLEGLNDGQDFPKDLLKALYNSIKNEKLQWTIDEEELRKSFSELADGRTDSASHTMKRISSGRNPFTGVDQHPGAAVYKNGFLVRKVHADSDGKKTPRGKRGWKTFYAILKGLILYLQKGEYRPEKQLSDEDLKNAVSIHHSLAMRAADYSKRPNVFYLRTADWRVFLFQAPNAEQMQSWITRINTVAAMFSAPPFPAAIGSQKKFSRPLLPGSSTKLSQEEQVQSHEARFRTVSSELTELRSCPPDRKIKSRELEEYRHREEYLEFEKTRYGTYAMLLRAKIRSGEDDLSAFESRLYEDNGLQRTHSSPTLQQESSQGSQGSSRGNTRGSTRGSNKGSKRSEGQRHSYWQAVKQ